MSKAVLLAALIVALAAPHALAQPVGTPSPSPSPSERASAPPAADDDGSGGGGLAGNIASGLAGRALDSLFETIGEAAVWAFGRVLSWVDATTSPDVTQPWFGEVYGRTYWLSAIIALIALVWALTTGALRNGVTGMASVLPRLLFVVLGLAVAVPIVQTLLEFTDWLSLRLGGQASENMQDMAAALGSILVGGSAAGIAARGTTVPGFVLALVGLVIVVGALLVWLQLIFRTAVIYLLLAAAAFPAAMSIHRASARPIRKIAAWIVALAFAKPVVVLALWIGSAPFAGDSGAGIAAVLTGAGVIATAVFAPWALFRLFDFAGDQVAASVSASANPRQMRTHVEHPVTTYRRTTTAVHDRASFVREHGLVGFGPTRPRGTLRGGALGSAVAGTASAAAAGGMAAVRAVAQRGGRSAEATAPRSEPAERPTDTSGGSGAGVPPAQVVGTAHPPRPPAHDHGPAPGSSPQPFVGPPSPDGAGGPGGHEAGHDGPPRQPRPPGMVPRPPRPQARAPAPPTTPRRPPVDPRGTQRNE